MKFELKLNGYAQQVMDQAGYNFKELNDKVFLFLEANEAAPMDNCDAGQDLHHLGQYCDNDNFLKDLTEYIYGNVYPEYALKVGRLEVEIVDSEDPCPSCGADLSIEWDYNDNGDSIKAEKCPNENCDHYNEDAFTRDEMLEP